MSGFTNQGVQNPDMWGLLNLMADPVKYKEKLTEVSELEQRLEAKIALAGHADQILALREIAIKNHEDAIAKLTAAETRAFEITQNAQDRAIANIEAAAAKIEEDRKAAQQRLEDEKAQAQAIIAKASAEADEERARLTDLKNEVYQQDNSVKETAVYYAGLVDQTEKLVAQNTAEQERLAALIAVTQEIKRGVIEKDRIHQEAFALFLDEHSQAYERYAAIKKATDEQ